MSATPSQLLQPSLGLLPSAKRLDPGMFEMISEVLATRDFNHYLYLYDSHKRMGPFLELVPYLDDAEYWPLLRSVWVTLETIHPYTTEWLALLQAARPGRQTLMSPEDHELLNDMPDTLTVFRGCDSADGARGLSWTCDLKQAVKFARYSCGPRRLIFGERKNYATRPRVVGGTCAKSDVLAYFNEREEEEIVINPIAVSINPVPVWPLNWPS